MDVGKLAVGSQVVYRMQKSSPTPGRRAQDVRPQTKGEEYQYIVEKHWTVKEIHDDGTITLITRRGKEHRIPADDPRLRAANFWQRWLNRARFPKLDTQN